MSRGHVDIAERDEVRLRRAAGCTEYPLSFNQRELWTQCQLSSARALNNIAVEVILTGPLDAGCFHDAFQAVVDRHETMRTAFHAPDGSPRQRVSDVRVWMIVRDFADVPADAQADAVRARAEELVRLPFVLDRAPLFRAELVRIDPGRHVFILVFHHLILDGFVLPQLLEELARTYVRFRAGDRHPLPPLALQYGDFAVWEDDAFNAGLLQQHESHWRARLRAPLPSMAIPGDRQPRSPRTFENGSVERRLPRPLARALRQMKDRYETTTFRTLTAAFHVLLWRLTGETDLLLALPMSARPDALGDAVGFFANTLPLRLAIDVERPFHHLLGKVTAEVRHAVERREFPLTEALRRLDLPRDPHRPPLPISVSQIRPFSTTAGPLQLQAGLVFLRATPFDLWLMVSADGDDIDLVLHYAMELFDRATIDTMATAFEALLASIVADPDGPIRSLGLLSAAERARVDGWGHGGPAPAAERGVVAELAQVAARTPGAIAVTAGETAWTYARLHAVAGRVAARLQAAGVGREARVGLLGARSAGMLATVVGVLGAGAAFVPLEASQPDARLQGIVAAAGLAAIVADRASAARARGLAPAHAAPVVLCWDDFEAGEAPGALPVKQRPADLAYIFYTSGSTGAPKGVMVGLRAMANHLRAKIATLGLDETSVVVQNAAAGFDVIVWQWLAPLLVGGRVLIYGEETADDPAALLAALGRDGATVVETVPSFLQALLDAGKTPAALPALRWVVSNAEALPWAIAARWHERYPGIRLLNTYGATECADDTTHGLVGANGPDAAARVAVGRPIAGVTVAVVDESLRPVPPGCVGEIVLGGVAVGRGYVGDPAATARAFVPDPHADTPGARLYRTGDRGRWTAAGALECLGRQDDQVKVHGYRVELGEVEAALAALPELAHVAAAVRTDARGQRRLVAYYVAATPFDPAVLRQALAARLPLYMVPDAWMWLAEMPRTSTGKLDRTRLPVPPVVGASGPIEAPASPLEAALASVWQQVLQVPSVGRHDNFFDLGGDSIQSILVASRLSQRGFRVAPRAVFAHQTIAELAGVVEAM